MTKFKDAWGWSKLDTYRACPQKFKFQFIDKIKDTGSAAMDRGSKIHADIESYLNGWGAFPESADQFRAALEELKTKDFKAEAAWGFDDQWGLLPDWFGKTTWFRSKLDARYLLESGAHLTCIDFKTGKYRAPSPDQIELYALAGFAAYPDVRVVDTEFWFIDTGEVLSRTYTRDADFERLKAKYAIEVSQGMYADEAFTPTPSNSCRWCQHSKTKGGKCQF
jgi:hypothetical protein